MLVLGLSIGVIPIVVGQGETIITLSAPGWMNDVYDADLFAPFEAVHPGVKIVFVPQVEDTFFTPAAYGLEEHLNAVEKFASSADVLYVSNYSVTVEATRAGYYLDMTPLVQSDSTLDTADFFPAVWQSYQWDGGVWALPVMASVHIFSYNRDTFDNAGLSYPNERWTLDDLADAARALTVRDADGKVTVPGIQIFSLGLLVVSSSGEKLYDDALIPSPPKFSSPNVAAILDWWAQLSQDMTVFPGFDFEKIPMEFGPPWRLTGGNPNDVGKWAGSLLPGGKAGLEVQGFAVSGGTLNPELAYALAKYLTESAEIASRTFGGTPARRSVVGVEVENEELFTSELPEEVQTLFDLALENAIPSSEMRFEDYLNLAINQMREENVDAATALQEAELAAIQNLEIAAERQETTTLMVATPVPTPSIAANQTVMRFGLNVYGEANPFRAQWEQLIQTFLAQHPAIGEIELVEQIYSPDDFATMDCYYQHYNEVQNARLEDFLNLDPFMDADPNFDADDFMVGVLAQVQRDNLTWAYPMTVQPSVLWYNSQMFTDAGLAWPGEVWTVEAFKEAMHVLKASQSTDEVVFVPQTFGNTNLLMLMAAFGALPYDFRTNPPTINFTDTTTVAAIRQVLDFAKDDYMEYNALASNYGGLIRPIKQAIFSESLTGGLWRFENRLNGEPDPYRVTNYPSGSQYVPVAFGIGVAYIRATAQNPEACYDWIRMIAGRPELFQAMPARYSLMHDPSLAMMQGDDVVALYEGFAQRLQQPNVVGFPEGGGSGFNGYVEQYWLNRAFDNYVLREGILEEDLAEAAQFIEGYRVCTANIPPFDPAIRDDEALAAAYYRQYTDCAVTLDPLMKEVFSYYYEESE
jgi:ABC-type glycerol-3-phosphate transport system substrate-binding protein